MNKEQYDQILKAVNMLHEEARMECGSYIQELVDDLRYLIILAKPEDRSESKK